MKMTTCDVAIVGLGPVGQFLSILLGQRGHSVVAIDKWPQPYPLPRAVTYDEEIARLLAFGGVADDVATISEIADKYEWHSAAGEPLLKFRFPHVGPMAWPAASMMAQPNLESVLARRIATIDSIAVRRGEEAVDVRRDADGVTLQTQDVQGERHAIGARYLIGCDGANSFVRGCMATNVTDLGFYYDWLILDIIPHEPRVFDPINLQICDPQRPVTVVSGGPGRRRFEIMRLPHESKDELHSVERAWEFLARWDFTPANATLERHAVYTFAAKWADSWRDGNLLLAGDAAHLMPPFAGQGMCSGMRDAANLAWKMDLVLRGTAPDALLDTYGVERSAHVQNAIGMSVALGNVICLTDPQAAATRDAGMIAAGAQPEKILPPLPPPSITGGVVHYLPDGAIAPGAGQLCMQAEVRCEGRTGRFDAVVGTGFIVLCAADPRPLLTAAQQAFLASIGATLVVFAPAGGTDPAIEHGSTVLCRIAVDLTGAYSAHFADTRREALVVRPDFYLFGSAERLAELPELIDELRRQLGAAAAADVPVTPSLALS